MSWLAYFIQDSYEIIYIWQPYILNGSCKPSGR